MTIFIVVYTMFLGVILYFTLMDIVRAWRRTRGDK